MIWAPLLVALFYGVIYSMMNPRDFGFKSSVDPFYFSFTTMSSVGYGDFSPKTDRAKMIVMTQQVIVIVGVLTLLEKFVDPKYLKS